MQKCLYLAVSPDSEFLLREIDRTDKDKSKKRKFFKYFTKIAGGSLISRIAKLDITLKRPVIIEVGMQNAAQSIALAASPFILGNDEMAELCNLSLDE